MLNIANQERWSRWHERSEECCTSWWIQHAEYSKPFSGPSQTYLSDRMKTMLKRNIFFMATMEVSFCWNSEIQCPASSSGESTGATFIRIRKPDCDTKGCRPLASSKFTVLQLHKLLDHNMLLKQCVTFSHAFSSTYPGIPTGWRVCYRSWK